jgi:hypothetical protein
LGAQACCAGAAVAHDEQVVWLGTELEELAGAIKERCAGSREQDKSLDQSQSGLLCAFSPKGTTTRTSRLENTEQRSNRPFLELPR